MSKLSWSEAQQAMRDGKRVSHEYFSNEEYFKMDNGVIFCEMGYNMTRWYRGEAWQEEGWRVVDA